MRTERPESGKGQCVNRMYITYRGNTNTVDVSLQLHRIMRGITRSGGLRIRTMVTIVDHYFVTR